MEECFLERMKSFVQKYRGTKYDAFEQWKEAQCGCTMEIHNFRIIQCENFNMSEVPKDQVQNEEIYA